MEEKKRNREWSPIGDLREELRMIEKYRKPERTEMLLTRGDKFLTLICC